jgi:uncharacterized membrane protein YdjX (TVP38/TMEM64 family)
VQSSGRRSAWAVVRLAVLVLLLVAAFVVGQARGWPSAAQVQERVEAAGDTGALVFVLGYAALALVPAPKAVLTAVGGALYGLWFGALLSWMGALIGAAVAFGLARAMGRDAVDRLLRGRLARVDDLLTDHGLGAVIAVRLVPVVPFTAINYGAALTGVRLRHYVLGSAVGMIPGALAYAALGAWGTDPWGIFAAVAALVLLIGLGTLLGRRLLPGSERRSARDGRD